MKNKEHISFQQADAANLLEEPVKERCVFCIFGRAILFFLPILIVLVLLLNGIYTVKSESLLQTKKNLEVQAVRLRAKTAVESLNTVFDDVAVLGASNEMQSLFSSDKEVADPSALVALQNEMVSVSRIRGVYDQLRFLDKKGMEVIRVNYSNGSVVVAPKETLQYKGDRYYFQETKVLDPCCLFVSKMDLNVEHGEVEIPLKPMIRVGLPVFDGQEIVRGVFVANYAAADLLANLEAVRSSIGAEMVLVDGDGYLLSSPYPDMNWGFMYEHKKDETFAVLYPREWEAIQKSVSGQFVSENGLFTYRSIRPLESLKKSAFFSSFSFSMHSYEWFVVSILKPEFYQGEMTEFRNVLMFLGVSFGVVLFALSVRLSWYQDQRRSVLNELRRKEFRYRMVTEFATEWTYLLDSKARARYMSRSCMKITGYTPEEFMERQDLLSSIIHGEDRELWSEFLLGFTDDTVPRHLRFRIINKQGKVRWLDNVSRLIPGTEQEILGIRGSIRDVTKMKEAMDEKEKLENQLLHTEKLKSLGVLAGGIAHQFNNLLMSVLGYTEILLKGAKDSSFEADSLKEIQHAANRAAELSGQMLAYSGYGKFANEELNLTELIRTSILLIDISIPSNIQLEFDMDEKVPLVLVDPSQIRQLLFNLLMNSIEAVGGEEGIITIAVKGETLTPARLSRTYIDDGLPEGEYVCFTITDNGCGMNSDSLEKIFDPFFTTKFMGRGLGMATVLGIVRGHKGAIEVKSREAEFSSVSVYLPGAIEYCATEGIPAAAPYPERTSVLVVDDEANILDIASMMLESAGVNTVVADDPSDALEVYRQRNDDFCCVLLDYLMPGMNGVELFKKMHEINPRVPVIICSGYTENLIQDKFHGLTIAGFLKKPFTSQRLFEKIQDVTKISLKTDS